MFARLIGSSPVTLVRPALLAASMALTASRGLPAVAATGPAPATGAIKPAADPAEALVNANAAFDDEEYDRALPIYQSVLAARPDDLQALRRAGTLLGWAGRPKEAIPLLDRAVLLEPGDRDTQRQLARVCSWAEEYSRSLKIYDRLVEEDPADLTTALERAQVLSWAGRLTDAEAAFREVLQKDPASTGAKVGLAQTLGWEGRYAESEALYREVQPKDPSAARLGLGRLSLLQGDPGAALRAARATLAQDPKSQDAKRLEKDALARLRPSLAFGVDLLDDTDENRNVTAWVTGSFHPGGLVDIDVTAATLGQEGPDLQLERLDGVDIAGDGTPDQIPGAYDSQQLRNEWLAVTAGLKAGEKGRVTLNGAAERLGTYDRPVPLEDRGTVTAFSGYAAYRLNTSPVGFGITIAHEIPKWTAFVTEENLRWNYARFEVGGPLPWRIGWSVSGDAGVISGGVVDNDRVSAWVRFTRPFETGQVTLTPRYTFRYLSYSENLNDGYFDPQSYVSNLVGLEVGGRTSAGHFEWALGGDIGIENFTFDAENSAVCELLPSNDLQRNCTDGTGSYAQGNILTGPSSSGNNTAENLFGRIAWTISDRFRLQAYAAWTNAAAQSATGYKSHAAGIAGRIRF